MPSKNQRTAKGVADYLNALDRTSANACTVTIGHSTYVGARYQQTCDVSPGCRAYTEGKRTYTTDAFYLLGELPPSYVYRHARAYIDADGARWFVGSYWSEDDSRMPESSPEERARGREYHQLGSMFQLMLDDYGVTLTGARGQSVHDRTMPMRVEMLS